jgi:hypothetical protein
VRARQALLASTLLLLIPAAAHASSVGHVRLALDSNASFPSYSQTAARNQVVVLQAWQQERLRALKAANPGVKVLVYKDLSFSTQGSGPGGYCSSGVCYSEADASHPEWFLKNTDGERFTSTSYSYLWAMDVGHPAYQQRWADNVVSELQSQGWDGVFMDDTNPTMKYHYAVGRVAKYPNDAAYSAATRSAVAAIGPRVRAAGKLAVANIGSWSEYYGTGVDWLQFLDGGMDEMFLKWGTARGEGYGDPYRWQTQLSEVKEAERQGKIFLGITHSDAGDARAALYGFATMMLGAEGRSHFALARDYTQETWFPEYEYDLGSPKGPESRDENGVHRRSFERGLVLVNPTGQSKGVSFGGAYSGSGLGESTTATMPPTSGLVLRGAPATEHPVDASLAVLATVKGPRQVELLWTRGGRRARRYRVRRNGWTIAVTRRRRLLDRRVRAGRRYRYTVTALDGRGRKLRTSRPARTRTAGRGRRRVVRASGARRRVRGAFGATDLRGWPRAYVERRARMGGRRVWRRASRTVRPHSTMVLRVRAPRTALVRLVVRSTSGAALRSTPLRAGR